MQDSADRQRGGAPPWRRAGFWPDDGTQPDRQCDQRLVDEVIESVPRDDQPGALAGGDSGMEAEHMRCGRGRSCPLDIDIKSLETTTMRPKATA